MARAEASRLKNEEVHNWRRRSAPARGLIITAGIPLGALAVQARVSASSLSNYLAGRNRNHAVQLAIWEAYRRLSRRGDSLAAFWGRFLSERIAS